MKATGGSFTGEETTIHNLGPDQQHVSALLKQLSNEKAKIFLDRIPTVLANRIESGIAALARRKQAADVVLGDELFDCNPPNKQPKIRKISPTTPRPPVNAQSYSFHGHGTPVTAEERTVIYAPVSITINCNGTASFPVTTPHPQQTANNDHVQQYQTGRDCGPPARRLIESMRSAIAKDVQARSSKANEDITRVAMVADAADKVRNVDALYALVGQYHSRQRESFMRAQFEHSRQHNSSNNFSITRIRQSECKATIMERLKRFAYEGEI